MVVGEGGGGHQRPWCVCRVRKKLVLGVVLVVGGRGAHQRPWCVCRVRKELVFGGGVGGGGRGAHHCRCCASPPSPRPHAQRLLQGWRGLPPPPPCPSDPPLHLFPPMLCSGCASAMARDAACISTYVPSALPPPPPSPCFFHVAVGAAWLAGAAQGPGQFSATLYTRRGQVRPSSPPPTVLLLLVLPPLAHPWCNNQRRTLATFRPPWQRRFVCIVCLNVLATQTVISWPLPIRRAAPRDDIQVPFSDPHGGASENTVCGVYVCVRCGIYVLCVGCMCVCGVVCMCVCSVWVSNVWVYATCGCDVQVCDVWVGVRGMDGCVCDLGMCVCGGGGGGRNSQARRGLQQREWVSGV